MPARNNYGLLGHAVEEEVASCKNYHSRDHLNNEQQVRPGDQGSYETHLGTSKKWERIVQLKDSAIQELLQALEQREFSLKRQEKLIEETRQRLVFQGKSEKANIKKKDLEISLLTTSITRQAEKLAEQAKLIAALNSQQERREQEVTAYSDYVKQKVDSLKQRFWKAEASLQSKEEEIEVNKKCCDDLKLVIWKKDRMLERHKLIEEQLQTALERKQATLEELGVTKHQLWAENIHMAKSLKEMKSEAEASEVAFQQDLKMRTLCLQKQKHQIQRLEMMLSQMETCLCAKNMELNTSQEETRRLVEDYNELKAKHVALTHEHIQLQIKLMKMEQESKNGGKHNNKSADVYLHGQPLDERVAQPQSGVVSQWQSNCLLNTVNSGCLKGADFIRMANVGQSRIVPPRVANCANACGKESLIGIVDKPERGKRILSFEERVPVDEWPSLPNVEDTYKDEAMHQDDCAPTSTSLELQRIEDEIRERERNWRQIEASMRAELSRRKVQLHDADFL